MIPNVFGDYFDNSIEILAKKFDNNENNCTTSRNVCNSMYFSPLTEETVLDFISKLSNKKSCGINEVPMPF